MPKKTLAAALAAAVLLPLLVFVDLPAAEAHEQTKTLRRCAYDPFAGNQCWNETVNVAHTHRVIPDNPPPDTSPKPVRCPAGTTGTPPDCSPVPPDNTNRVTPTTTAPPPPTTTTTEPPKCPPGYTGTPPNCEPPKCPPGWTGTPPNCQVPPPPCSWPKHSHGDTCHGPHVPPCGTGTWSPGHGHSPIQRPPCPTEPKTTEPTVPHRNVCRGVGDGQIIADGKLKDANGTVLATCTFFECKYDAGNPLHFHAVAQRGTRNYRAAGASGTCHPAGQSHCVAGQHSHAATKGTIVSDAHGAGHGNCHPADGAGYRHGCPSGGHLHDGLDCHSPSVDNCPDGEHEHTAKGVFPKVQGCHDLDAQHNTGDLSRTAEVVHTATGEVVCFAAGGAVVKAAKLVAKGAAWLSKLLKKPGAEKAIETGSQVGCGVLYDKLIREEQRQHEADKKDDHDDHADEKREQDQDGQDGDDEAKDDGAGQQPTPTPEADPIPERPSTAEWAKEWQRYQNAKDNAEARKRWDQVQCNYHSSRGRTGYCG